MGFMNGYEVQRTAKVDSGGNSSIYLASHPFHTNLVVKETLFDHPSKQDSYRLEIEAYKHLKAVGGCDSVADVFHSEQNSSSGKLFMKRYQSSLFDVISDNMLSNGEVQNIFKRICRTVETFHQAGLAHLDLKLENILLHHRKPIIIDFGSSWIVNEEEHKYTGTEDYMPPELLLSSDTLIDPFAVDIYSLGIILHCCLTGLNPRGEDGKIKLSYAETHLHPTIVQLLSKMLDSNPSVRPTIREVLQHHWVRGKIQKFRFLKSTLLSFQSKLHSNKHKLDTSYT